MMMITGHSGFEGTGAGTLYSVETAIGMGLDCVEVDARLDPEGTPRLSHDDFKDYRNAVPVRDAFKLIAQSEIAVNVDLKTPETLHPVLELAEECGFRPGQLIFSGNAEGELLEEDPSIAKRARIFWNIGTIRNFYFRKHGIPEKIRVLEAQKGEQLTEYESTAGSLDEIIETAKAYGAAAINLPYALLTDETIPKLFGCGIPISIWTVNDEALMRRFFGLSAYNITTNQPTLACRVRKEFK